MIRVAIIGIVGDSIFLPVERFHEGGETVVAKGLHREWGGKGFNQAIAAARHGAAVSFLAAIGESDRDSIERFAAANGIDCTLLAREQGSPVAVIMTDAAGANRVTVYQGAQLTVADVACFADQIAAADVLLLSNEVPTEVLEEAIRVAACHGVRVILNPAPARALTPFILEHVSLFTPNEHETEGLDGKQNVIVTLGARGCYLRESDELVPAVRAGDVTDTTGAGDTFNGVLAVCLAEGNSPALAVRTANAAAGIKVTGRYVADAIPTRKQTQALLEEYYGHDLF